MAKKKTITYTDVGVPGSVLRSVDVESLPAEELRRAIWRSGLVLVRSVRDADSKSGERGYAPGWLCLVPEDALVAGRDLGDNPDALDEGRDRRASNLEDELGEVQLAQGSPAPAWPAEDLPFAPPTADEYEDE